MGRQQKASLIKQATKTAALIGGNKSIPPSGYNSAFARGIPPIPQKIKGPVDNYSSPGFIGTERGGQFPKEKSTAQIIAEWKAKAKYDREAHVRRIAELKAEAAHVEEKQKQKFLAR